MVGRTSNKLGDGEYEYEIAPGWPTLPDDIVLKDVCGLGIDANQNIYVFNRGDHPMVVLDPVGNMLRSWGEGEYLRPHGVCMGLDGNTIWLTDDEGHSVRQCTLDGEVIMTLGPSQQPAGFMGGKPFNKPTHTAVSPEGDVYVSDGYGNHSIHKFSSEGIHLLSWGLPGVEPGEFHLPHNILCGADGLVYVADRENHRVQIFNSGGEFLTQWNNFYKPMGLYMMGGDDPVIFISEGGPHAKVGTISPNLGARVTIVNRHGKRLGRLGGWQPGEADDQFLAPHCMVVDGGENLYVGEVSWSTWPKKFPHLPQPSRLRSIRKLRRLHTKRSS